MDITLPAAKRPKSRQSIAHLPSKNGAGELKENVTDSISSSERSKSTGPHVDKKKTRGKSLGPGGLETLKETNRNATQVSSTRPESEDAVAHTLQTSLFTPRSILKPTIPLTPPKAIPSFDELRKRSTGKGKSPAKGAVEDLLIDFSTPGPSKATARVSVSDIGGSQDPFSPITRKSPRGQTVALRTEDEQQDAAREREAEEQRKAQKEAALAQRAARRKSMANRRVSFAPEATLHTWNVIELAEDSTTSSASNSTRRQSSMTTAQSPYPAQSPIAQDAEVETPPEQVEDPITHTSPGNQREAHQKKRRRRSSTAPPRTEVEQSPESAFSSSPIHSSSVASGESSPARIEDSIHSSSDDDDDETEVDDGTAMSMDDATSQTVGSNHSGSSTTSLDERLRLAAGLAGTRGIEYDENGDDLPMEMVTGTVTTAFQPFAAKQSPAIEHDLSSMQEQENINPFPPDFKADVIAKVAEANQDEDEDMTMDVTQAIGGIVPGPVSPNKGRRKSVASSRRRSSVARRRSLAEESEGETMDLTTVGGGILPNEQNDTQSTKMSDEDLSMDFTNVVGGVLAKNGISRRESTQSMMDENETMDMTAAFGGILPPIEERTEPMTEDDRTVTMDMTRAVGAFLPASLSTKNKTLAKQLMEEEASVGQLTGSPQETATRRASATPSHVATSVASETGSPSIALKPRTSARKSLDVKQSESTTPRHMTPTKASMSKQATPTKQVTPMPIESEKPNRATPLSANVTHRGASPKKLFKAEIKARASPGNAKTSTLAKKASLFDHDEHTGHATPSVVLHAPKPHQHLRRRSSGIGIDQEGLGSPSVTKLLDRRASIGDSVPAFAFDAQVPSCRLRFEDPRALEAEIDAERAEEKRRESGRFIMEREADEENATLQLKEMIQSLTPKKNKLKGRKSLAPGGAKGILGKRPAELDMDDDDEGENTPKRLKMVEREASPVKKIKLAQPPSADETTGRLTRAQRQGLQHLTANITPTLGTSPRKSSAANTPQHGRFKEAPTDGARPSSFEDRLDNVIDAVDMTTAKIEYDEDDGNEDERISLQSFLNMTNIHFIELSTTKRRHTIAPQPSRSSQENEESQPSLEACLIAAATTLPLLELYQHATRELKQYISTGRKIIRSIETETLKEQPQLFREYVDARPDVKVVMDNQFRNGKTNARLQSKEGWYAWRRQLVDGLRGGLEGIKCGMEDDAAQLQEQEAILGSAVPDLITQHAELEEQLQTLEQRVAEHDSLDHEALSQSRQRLQTADDDFKAKLAQLEELQQQMQDKTETLAAASELKDEMLEQIAEAERVHEECRGWSGRDVRELKSKVERIEQESGWKLLSAEEDEETVSGVAITMAYKDELRLFFYPAAFMAKSGRRRSGRKSRSVSGPTAPISLTFSPKHEETSSELSTERRFFLQMMRSQLHAFAMMPKRSVSAKTVLSIISQGWEMASKVSEEVRLLNMAGITNASILGDEQLGASLVFMLNGSRINIDFALRVSVDTEGSFINNSSVTAKAVYGVAADLLSVPGKSRKVQTALSKEVESRDLGSGAWLNAVKGLESWIETQLQARKEAPSTAPAAVSSAPAPAQPAPSQTTSRPTQKSPLAPKSTNRVQKRSIPLPQQREKLTSIRLESRTPKAPTMSQEENKENVTPVKQKMGPAEVPVSEFKDDGWEAKAAIPPEMQEEMMRTPIKRVGALRRSPIVG
jgi:kinetochore protein Spc7/SPC105